ncbi:MAG TPA: hypothetical protein P5239_07035 [Victivallales bacterium]|nr:hypothetical protein [Victivallales bacterium]HRU01441.1 hypothetical protein [Victivallales bacterium]
MKKLIEAVLILFVVFLVSSCSSYRLIAYKYDDVVMAASEKFNVNEWTEFYTKKSSAKEKPGKKVIFTHYDWSYHDYKIMCQVEILNEKGIAEVYVFVRDWNNWLSPLTYNPSYARKVLDLLEKRMQDGTWSPMPWSKEEMLR